MSAFIGLDARKYKTASELLTAFPSLAGKDNYYLLYPQGSSAPGQLVWCDMTTDSGGWMMIARSHPTTVNYNGKNWGWQGGDIGSVKDFSQAYQAGWWTYWNGNATFTSYIFGNRANINNNTWGSFVYKVGISSYSTFVTSDTQQGGASYTTLKSDTSVYQFTNFPGMQGAIGYPVSGTANNLYYMRDCCGFTVYGGIATQMVTTYCGSDSVTGHSGPWCGGASTDGSGNFLSNTYVTAGGNRYGGTHQYMIMVR
jgi:hypothetical protein